MRKIVLVACAVVATSATLPAAAATSATLPKVWMSAQWRDPYEETVRACAEQGVDVV